MKDKTPKTNKMKDKTPKTKAENPVNIPTAFASTTDTVRDGEPKNQTLPQADALKDRFKAGSIPLQTDFADLIDIANIGRQAVGGAEGQAGPANGFNLSSTGSLELKPKVDNGISVDKDGVAVKVNTAKGLKVDKDGVYLPLGWGPMHTDSGLSVYVGHGLQCDQENGVSLAPGHSFERGMILMFSGTNIPPGWALCDGNSGTPNLIDRFNIGGKNDDVGKTGGQSLTGFIMKL